MQQKNCSLPFISLSAHFSVRKQVELVQEHTRLTTEKEINKKLMVCEEILSWRFGRETS